MKRLYLLILLILCTTCIDIQAQGVVTPVQTIQATRSFPGASGSLRATGTFQMRLGSSKTSVLSPVTRPIIVVEGWDPLNVSGHNDIFQTLDLGLRNRLFADDYDIITLNFDDTSLSIEYNAMLLVELIEQVNQNLKTGNEQAVVIGMSMGGLASRLALRVMENMGLSHETRLYVSFDTPHQGATVPEGLYSMAVYLTNWEFTVLGNTLLRLRSESDELFQLYSILSSASVSQMLKNDPLQASFQNTLDNFGYPENLRKVAISNGSMVGRRQRAANGQFLNPGDVMLNFNDNNLFNLEDIIVGTANVQVRAPSPGVRIADLDLDVRIDALTVEVIDFEDYTTSNDKAYEIYAGGTREIEDILGNGVVPNNAVANPFTFIPFASALDIDPAYGNNLSLNLSLANAGIPGYIGNWDILCHSPFDNIIAAPGDNEDHLEMTPRTGDWLYDEIDQEPSGTLCRNFCRGKLELTDLSEGICSGETRTVRVEGLIDGYNVNWSVGSGLTIVGSNTGSSIQVTPNPFNANGTATISATITTPCDILPTIVSRTIPVNTPSHLSTIYYDNGNFPNEICTPTLTTMLTFQAGSSSTALYYEWESSLPLANSTSQGIAYTSSLATLYSYPYSESHYIRVRAVNACGASTWATKTFTLRYDPYNCSGSGGGPGPGPGPISVRSLMDLPSFNLSSGKIKLYNSSGRLVYSGSEDLDELGSIEESRLPDGHYFLHFIHDKGVIRKQIWLRREE